MNLLETDFYVTKPVLAIHVPFGKGEPVHSNRPSHGFAYFADGVYTYTFENKKTIVCKKGDLIYMPQYSNYTVTPQSHTEGAAKSIFAINFLISSGERFEPFKIAVKSPAKIEALFDSAEREWVKKDVGYADAVYSDLYKILSLIKKDYRSDYYGSRYREIISPAISYISNNYTTEKITAEALADVCGISVSYLRRLFSRCYGVSPIEYIINLRLEYAKEMIYSGDFSVTAAAEKSGFNDISYFSRTFKKHFGVPPTNWV